MQAGPLGATPLAAIVVGVLGATAIIDDDARAELADRRDRWAAALAGEGWHPPEADGTAMPPHPSMTR